MYVCITYYIMGWRDSKTEHVQLFILLQADHYSFESVVLQFTCHHLSLLVYLNYIHKCSQHGCVCTWMYVPTPASS